MSVGFSFPFFIVSFCLLIFLFLYPPGLIIINAHTVREGEQGCVRFLYSYMSIYIYIAL